MKEKDYYASVSKYYTKHATHCMAIEVKITKTDSIAFNCLAAHQEMSLLQSERAYAHKIADVGMLKKPYDIMLIHRAIPILVVVFYLPRRSVVLEIPIRNFIFERERSKRKSLTLERAKAIASRQLSL
jgi:hypothetical protein